MIQLETLFHKSQTKFKQIFISMYKIEKQFFRQWTITNSI